MAKFTKSVEKKVAPGTEKVLAKKTGGVQKLNKKNGQNKPAVAPAASKPTAAVKAAIVAEAKAPKPVKAAAAAPAAKPTDKAGKLCASLLLRTSTRSSHTCSFFGGYVCVVF